MIALCGGIVLEEALDLSSDRLLNNNNNSGLVCSELLPTNHVISIHYSELTGIPTTWLHSFLGPSPSLELIKTTCFLMC